MSRLEVDVVLFVFLIHLREAELAEDSQSCFDLDFGLGSEIFQSATKPFIICLLSERASDSESDSNTAAAAPAESDVDLPEFVSLTLRL